MMNIEDSTKQPTDEERFIRDALASAEKAEMFHRIKLIAVTLLALGGVYYAFDQPVTAQRTAFTVAMVVGLMLAVCTAKILASINKNTRVILQAFSERSRR